MAKYAFLAKKTFEKPIIWGNTEVIESIWTWPYLYIKMTLKSSCNLVMPYTIFSWKWAWNYILVDVHFQKDQIWLASIFQNICFFVIYKVVFTQSDIVGTPKYFEKKKKKHIDAC